MGKWVIWNMGAIRKRPIRLKDDKNINVKELETIYQHYDDALVLLDRRRIAQQGLLDSGADAATIVTALNALIVALNASDLTDE